MYDTEHEAVPAVAPAVRLQAADDGVNVPVLFVVKLTIPLGVVGVEDASVTVAVHVLATFVLTEFGEQVTDVDVACGGGGVVARLNDPWLMAWVESPPYDPVIMW